MLSRISGECETEFERRCEPSVTNAHRGPAFKPWDVFLGGSGLLVFRRAIRSDNRRPAVKRVNSETSFMYQPVETELRERLTGFIEKQTGGPVTVGELTRYSVGFSWLTYGFEATWQEGGQAAASQADRAYRSARWHFCALQCGPPVRRTQGARAQRRSGSARLLVHRFARGSRCAVLPDGEGRGRGAAAMGAGRRQRF